MARFAVPFLGGKRNCTDDRPCRRSDPCDRCNAARYLTAADWHLIGFYQHVHDQYINQSPMGEPVLTPRLEGWEAALRVYDYPAEDWDWLLTNGLLLHRLVHKLESINRYELAQMDPAEFTDGD